MSPYHQSFADFLAMGGYAVFVWASYGIVAVTLVINAVWPVLRHRQMKSALRRRLAAEAEENISQGQG